MTDDSHLPAPGQFCPVCDDHDTDHADCWDSDRPDEDFELFTGVHDVMKRAVA